MPDTAADQRPAVVAKLWSFCDFLRDSGLSNSEYLEQLTYLLFLKMLDERAAAPGAALQGLPDGCDWSSIADHSGTDLTKRYARILAALGRQPGLLGLIFDGARNRIRSAQALARLVEMIGAERWNDFGGDVLGDAYEGLLERTAADVKSGAGQYFTPRALTHAMVDAIQPRPGERITDPACGTGGFLVAAYDYVSGHHRLTKKKLATLRRDSLHGTELVEATARLCGMNLFLHGIIGDDVIAELPIEVGDALRRPPAEKAAVVLANPPFGRRTTSAAANGSGSNGSGEEIPRADFWAITSNKQLNFLQHIVSMLDVGGRAAVIVPDNVLFERGKAAETIRRQLLDSCDLHTMLRLPTGIFYAQSVKANVLFFERPAPSEDPATEAVWVYDLRTDRRFTRRERPLRRADMDEFLAAFRPGQPPAERAESAHFRRWAYPDLITRPEVNLDVWANLDHQEIAAEFETPEAVAERIVTMTTAAVESFAAVRERLLSEGERDG
jgi:type I restriction enzyme M protein